jgi:hypothetical protein
LLTFTLPTRALTPSSNPPLLRVQDLIALNFKSQHLTSTVFLAQKQPRQCHPNESASVSRNWETKLYPKPPPKTYHPSRTFQPSPKVYSTRPSMTSQKLKCNIQPTTTLPPRHQDQAKMSEVLAQLKPTEVPHTNCPYRHIHQFKSSKRMQSSSKSKLKTRKTKLLKTKL